MSRATDWVRDVIRKWLDVEPALSSVRRTTTLTTEIARVEQQCLSIKSEVQTVSNQLAEQVRIGVDFGIHEESVLVILSRLGNGQVRIVPLRFKNLQELNEMLREIERTYGNKREVTVDLPVGMRPHDIFWRR